IWTAEDYRELLETLWGIYTPVEDALMKIDWRDSGIDILKRRKKDWLEADLTYLGIAPASLRDSHADLPELDTRATGLGALYVLEGATLGGQIILRHLQPVLGISATCGGRFYASYGAQTSAMWRSYLAVLEKEGARPQMADAIEHGAVETFRAFERRLAPVQDAHPSEAAYG
ncbi:MAG: biliverdin-producing heme oxygenase, partial [Proteobacteria bacterium]|nr:biliverdin-producing heme oxygenase [Pseudomonadota bacterium]